MKIKGHIIAKIVLIVLMSVLFSILGLTMKDIPETNVIKQHEESLSLPTTTFSNRVDKWLEIKSEELYYAIKPLSDNSLIIYSLVFSLILVLFMDITIGIGRSRREEREELKKQGLL